jgi:hypothetical protein
MTDRLKGCTVVFTHDIRDDDAEAILNAIRMVKGVLSVDPSLASSEDWMMRERVKSELGEKLWQVLYPKDAA